MPGRFDQDSPVVPPLAASFAITDWNPIHRNTLIGSFTVQFPFGMIISGCMVHRKQGQDGPAADWIAFPGAPQVDGNMVKKAGDGKPMYKTLIKFTSPDVYKSFQVPILRELRRLGHI